MDVNISEVIFTILNFVILVAILTKFLWKPITKALDDRRAGIEESLALADQSRKDSEEMQARLTAELDKARKEAAAIVEESRKVGETVKSEIVADAKAAALRITAQAEAEIEQQKTEAIHEIKGQVADMICLVSQKLVEDSMDDAKQKSLVDKYIKEVGGLQ